MSYKPRSKAWKHQTAYLGRILHIPKRPSSADVFAVLAEMGTGKSKMVLDEWGAKVATGALSNLLIVAPAGSYNNWWKGKTVDQLSELETHLDPNIFKETIILGWRSGMNVAEKKRLDWFLRQKGKPRVLVVNVEALAVVERAIEVCEVFLKSAPTMMVIDESTRVRNPTAQRTRNVSYLGDFATSRRIMTGLVTPKNPLDLFAQFAFLDWRILGHRSYYTFRQRYSVIQKVQFQGRVTKKGNPKMTDVVVGFRNVEELHARIAPYSFRVLKEDCLDIPKKLYLPPREVLLTKEQKKHIGELLQNATTELDSGAHVTALIKLALQTKIAQILCGHVVDENGDEHDIPSNRYQALVETLDEHSGKAIVWFPWRTSLARAAELVRAEYGAESVAEFHGGNRKTRGAEERRFLGDENCRWMFSTPASGGIGNTWNVANLTVFFANDNDLEHRLQAEDRNHRGGQEKRVSYLDFISPEVKADMKKIRALRKKIDIATAIMGDDYREWLV